MINKKSIEFISGRVGFAEITQHFSCLDNSFLSTIGHQNRVELYVKKISEMAECFQAWEGNKLIGLVAIYCNAPNKSLAFITYVGVLPGWQFQGIASRLIQMCITHTNQLNFSRIELEVRCDNLIASNFYKKHGFNFYKEDRGISRFYINLMEK